eukprot:TRINITY_DN5720_c0_g1_i1.p1 TRINITY_DN5720_c0_g1~~TRINITY_DN5720_c0_g1_i1.p1  ORF type:complete len:284 (-),score=31.61 TRINITY_DN5720_c0_g1_i1:286-1137(-)
MSNSSAMAAIYSLSCLPSSLLAFSAHSGRELCACLGCAQITRVAVVRRRHITSACVASQARSLSSAFFAPGASTLIARQKKCSQTATPYTLAVRAAQMESKAVPRASRAPEFELEEPLTKKIWKLEDFEAYPALLVIFACNHCPFVVHLKEDLVKFANEYIPKGLAVVAISSNSVTTHPQDGPDFMAQEAKQLQYPFPYVYDKTQDVAKAFGAACTPDFFLYKKDGRRPFELAYHGRYDDSRPRSSTPITGRDLRLAADCVLSGRPVQIAQRPSIGCSIKWEP